MARGILVHQGIISPRRLTLGAFSSIWSVTFNSNDSGQENISYRNVFTASANADAIQLRCASSTTAALDVDNVSIQKHNGSGAGDATWAAGAGYQEILFGSASGFSLSSNSQNLSDTLILKTPIVASTAYLICFDIASTNGNPRRLDGSGTTYSKTGDTYNDTSPASLSSASRVYIGYDVLGATYA